MIVRKEFLRRKYGTTCAIAESINYVMLSCINSRKNPASSSGSWYTSPGRLLSHAGPTFDGVRVGHVVVKVQRLGAATIAWLSPPCAGNVFANKLRTNPSPSLDA